MHLSSPRRRYRWMLGIPLSWAILLFGYTLAQKWECLEILKYYPAFVSLLMLSIFGHSLWFPPTYVEKIARLYEPNLPQKAIIYTRRVTIVWCGFFLLNGTIACLTARYLPERMWMLYNGGISYLLMGGLFAGELIFRQRMQHGS